MVKLEIENATFNVWTDTVDYEDDFPGTGEWTFAYRELKRILKKLPRLDDSPGIRGEITVALEQVEDIPSDELGDAVVTITNPDTAITVVCAMLHLGGEWTLNYTGHDSEYWFYHDLSHAMNDASVAQGGPYDGYVEMYIDENQEAQAMQNGAKLARENGVPLSDIVRQLVKAEVLWKDRFGHETDLLRNLDELVSN